MISNTCSQYYFIKETEAQAIDKGDKVRILCMSAYYEHKNLILIPEVAGDPGEVSEETRDALRALGYEQ